MRSRGHWKRRVAALAVTCAVLVGLLAWAPWITPDYAQAAAVRAFELEWRNVADGCGFNCQGCGPVGVGQPAFGRRVLLEYACGLEPDTRQNHQVCTVFVSFLGTVHGVPRS